MEKFSVNIIVREEKDGEEKFFIVNNDETGIANFGDTLEEAINNFRKSLNLYLEAYPEKRKLLIEEQKEPLFLSRILV